MPEQLNLDELVQEHRVHRKIYTEPEIFALEMERIFERGWVFLGHESEVAQVGDYKTVRFGSQPAIMTRDEDGAIHVIMNRCMHRGATICQQERGNANYFRCWYHGWTYSSRGELIGLPYPGGYGSHFDRGKFALIKAARVATYRGLVFASLTPEVEELPDYLGAAKYYLDLFMDLSPEGAVEARAGTHKYGYDGNWKFQMENGVDGYHANFVHQSFFEVQGKKLGRKVAQLFTESSAMESKDLGHGHSILDMAPKRQAARPVSNLLRGATSQAATDTYMASLTAALRQRADRRDSGRVERQPGDLSESADYRHPIPQCDSGRGRTHRGLSHADDLAGCARRDQRGAPARPRILLRSGGWWSARRRRDVQPLSRRLAREGCGMA